MKTLPSEQSAAAFRIQAKIYLNIILPLFLTSIIAYLDRQNLSYAKLTMNADMNFSEEMYGFGAGIFFLGYILFEVPGALIAERFSPKWWIARIMISWGILTFFLAFIQNAWQFYLLRFLIGAAEASLYPVIYASVIPRWFVKGDRARAISILLTSLQLSAIIGGPIAGTLIDIELPSLHGWQSLFVLESLPAILLGPFIAFWMADRPSAASWLSQEEKEFLITKLTNEAAQETSHGSYSLRQAFRDTEVLKLCLIYFLWLTAFWGFNNWLPTLLKAMSGLTNTQVGWLTVIPMSMSLLFMLWIGHSSSKTGEKRWHGAIGLFIATFGMAMGTFTDNKWLAFACLCVTAIGIYSPMGVWWSYPTTFLSGAAAAGAIGLINSCGNFGGFVGTYLMGIFKQWTGSSEGGSRILALFMLVAALLMLTCKKKPNNNQD
ncbi:MAG: MFS transporter [Planctomycetaceae bacterium]